MGHVVSFYFFLIGIIYSTEAAAYDMVRLAWFSLGRIPNHSSPVINYIIIGKGLNLTAFIIRTSYEMQYIDYHPISYA